MARGSGQKAGVSAMTNTELIELERIRHLESWLKDQEHRIDLLVARQQWLEQRVKTLEQERIAA